MTMTRPQMRIANSRFRSTRISARPLSRVTVVSASARSDATEMFNRMIPLGRRVKADEIAKAALFIASDQSGFTTRATLMVDGGMSA